MLRRKPNDLGSYGRIEIMLCEICSCPEKEVCILLKKHLSNGPLWKIWTGQSLTKQKCNAHRGIWLQQAGLTSIPEHLLPTLYLKATSPNETTLVQTPKKPCGCKDKQVNKTEKRVKR